MKNTGLPTMLQKQEFLENTKTQLKKEFVGIDTVIDQVVDSLSSWYLFPNIQERPVIVNLWGLTGVGKSSLVARLTELLHLEHKYYHFDLGDTDTNDYTIKKQLTDIYTNQNGFPIIMALDEFQHARTIDENGKEHNNAATRIVWQLIDSGRFQINANDDSLQTIYHLIQKLNHLMILGVDAEKGYVTAEMQLYKMKMKDYTNLYGAEGNGKIKPNEKLHFVPKCFYDNIFSVTQGMFSTWLEVPEYLEKLNAKETVAWLNQILEKGLGPKTVDCSKALIFILGNLDEAYHMSSDFNPDMDADEFHQQSLKITVPKIKEALQLRFRNEQIARLGNTHIIYPAFNKESFEKIILLELVKIHDLIFEKENTHLYFDASIVDLIYKEGVYPTQGTRPVYTTIQQLIKTKLGKILTERTKKWLSDSEVLVSYNINHLKVEYVLNNICVHTIDLPIELNLDKLRLETKDDIQAIIAVHESGHAIASTILLHTVPEVVYSKTADAGMGGFAAITYKWKYISKQQVLGRLAVLMAGHAAEKIIFGEEHVTNGATGDLSEATQFIAHILKETGMGSIMGTIQTKSMAPGYLLKDELNAEVQEWLHKAYALAEKTLRTQEALLLHMANYLADHRKLTKPQLIDMVKQHAVNYNISDLIENADHLYYRKELKRKVYQGEMPKVKVDAVILNSKVTKDFTPKD